MTDPGVSRAGLLARLLFAFAALFTLVGAVELAFIGVDLATGSISTEIAPDLGVGIRSWTVHHAMRPGYDVPPVRTNSFGLRSPEVAVPKPAGTFRVLLLGDSFTFGFGAQEDETFARQLEADLRQRYGRETIEVVNAGVLSYCPLLEYLQYRHHLHVLEPDVVVVNFDMSDVQDHLAYLRDAGAAMGALPRFVSEPSLADGTRVSYGLLSFKWIAHKAAAGMRRFQSASEDVPFAKDEDRYLWTLDNGPEMDAEVADTLAPVAELKRLLDHHRIPLVLATYPQPWQVSADATPLPPIRDQYGIGANTAHLNDRAFRKLDAFASSHGIAFVNATAAFRGAADPSGLFLPNDFHFSPRGNELYAEVLSAGLRERGLVPGARATDGDR